MRWTLRKPRSVEPDQAAWDGLVKAYAARGVQIAALTGRLAAAHLEIGELGRENAELRRVITDADNTSARTVTP